MGSANSESDVKTPWIETPLVESALLSKAAGCRIFLKLENIQPSGSFKSRGVGNLLRQSILTHPSPQTIHFHSSSGGNAGLACVTAATSLGYPSTVVVPLSTKPQMIEKIRAAGARAVIQHGASWVEADQYLREEILAKQQEGGVYVPPFDHPWIWEGNSGIVDEVARQLPGDGKPDAMVCAVGGGGLFSGVVMGLDRAGWGQDVDVVTVETKGAESLNASLLAGERVTLPAVSSIATSLGAKTVCERAWQCAQRGNVKSVVVTDGEAAMGCLALARDERMLVEAACGASMALCYEGRLKRVLPKLGPESRVVMVVCGGSIVSLDTLDLYKREYAAARAAEANGNGAEVNGSG